VAGETIESTYRHPYRVVRGEALASRPWLEHLAEIPQEATTQGRWVDSCDLRVGDELLLRDGRIAPVEWVEHCPFDGLVYNMEVEDLGCYSVGQGSVLVHNHNSKETGPGGGNAPKTEVMPGAEARTRPGNSGRGTPKRPGFKPEDAPGGTRAINEHPDTKNIVHQIKRNLQEDGVGPASYVGVAPNGDIIVSNPDGTASNLGSWWHYK
jgi:hypothetical protein